MDHADRATAERPTRQRGPAVQRAEPASRAGIVRPSLLHRRGDPAAAVGAAAFASFTLRLAERYFVICSERPVVEHRRRKMRARPLLDPFAQGRIPSAPCTLAPRQSVNLYQDWRCKQLYRSCLAGVRPDHLRSCDRQFLPTPFRQLGALSRWGALLRSLATELVWR